MTSDLLLVMSNLYSLDNGSLCMSNKVALAVPSQPPDLMLISF